MQTKTDFGTFGMMLKCDNSFKTKKKKTFAQDLYRYSPEQKYGTQHEYINTDMSNITGLNLSTHKLPKYITLYLAHIPDSS